MKVKVLKVLSGHQTKEIDTLEMSPFELPLHNDVLMLHGNVYFVRHIVRHYLAGSFERADIMVQ